MGRPGTGQAADDDGPATVSARISGCRPTRSSSRSRLRSRPASSSDWARSPALFRPRLVAQGHTGVEPVHEVVGPEVVQPGLALAAAIEASGSRDDRRRRPRPSRPGWPDFLGEARLDQVVEGDRWGTVRSGHRRRASSAPLRSVGLVRRRARGGTTGTRPSRRWWPAVDTQFGWPGIARGRSRSPRSRPARSGPARR